jgi:hypothetical protein
VSLVKSKFNSLLKSKLIEAYKEAEDKTDAKLKSVFEKVISEESKENKGETIKLMKPKRYEDSNGQD